MITKIGLDLGYANITLSDSSYEVYREPSVMLIDKNTRRMVSVGKEALASDSADGILIRPFKNGLLYSAEFTSEIIGVALKTLGDVHNVRCVFGVPSNINAKQQGELFEIIQSRGVSECFFVNRASAAIVGAGYAPTSSIISVNIGACATEISIFHRGSIVYSEYARIGGENFDEAVQKYILEKGELNISLLDARAIKETIGAVWDGRGAEPISISGTLALTGNKIKMSIGTEDILGVFEQPLHALLSVIAEGVKRIPADCVEEIFANGIILSGGGAELFGLDKMISNVFGIATSVARNPADCVPRGLSIINGFLPKTIRANGKNITTRLAKYFQSNKK